MSAGVEISIILTPPFYKFMKQSIIKSKNFILRPLRKDDAVSLAEFANNKNVARFMNEKFPHPYRLSDAKKFIEFNIKLEKEKKPKFINFGIEINKRIVGMIGIAANFGQHQAEMGFWLGEPYWGKGIMTRVVNEIVKYCFNILKLHRVQARVIKGNKSSISLLKKNKFRQEGFLRKALFKKGKTYDVYLLARVK